MTPSAAMPVNAQRHEALEHADEGVVLLHRRVQQRLRRLRLDALGEQRRFDGLRRGLDLDAVVEANVAAQVRRLAEGRRVGSLVDVDAGGVLRRHLDGQDADHRDARLATGHHVGVLQLEGVEAVVLDLEALDLELVVVEAAGQDAGVD